MKKTVLAQRSLFSSKSMAERIPKILNDVLICSRKKASLERSKNNSADLRSGKKVITINMGSHRNNCNDSSNINNNDDGNGAICSNDKAYNDDNSSDGGSSRNTRNKLGEKLNISDTTFKTISKNILSSHAKQIDLLHPPEQKERIPLDTICRPNKYELKDLLLFRMTPSILNLLRRIQRFEQVSNLFYYDSFLHYNSYILLLLIYFILIYLFYYDLFILL